MGLRDEIQQDLRAEHFSTDDHAESVSYVAGEAEAVAIPAIFFDTYAAALADQVPVESAKVHFLVMASDIPAVAHADTITREEVVWNVIEIIPLGDGLTRLNVSQD